MTNRLSIANDALIEMGEPPIESLTDSNKRARIMNQRSGQIIRSVLAAGSWAFARKRASIAASPTAPPFEFPNAYPLPGDFDALQAIYNGYGFDYRIEGTEILSHVGSPIQIVYTRKVDPDELGDAPELFIDACVFALAARTCAAITGSKEQAERLRDAARFALADARHRGAIQQPAELFDADTWLLARHGWSGYGP